MKGVVFTEFLEMVEDTFSPEVADQMLEVAAPPSGGIYTSVGTYDHREMVSLVMTLSSLLDAPASQLLRAFGEHLFARFFATFPVFFEGVSNSFEFLERVDSLVHLEVQKLYPDAELPSFACHLEATGALVMEYRSERNLPDLAEGLIRGCFTHFAEDVEIVRSYSTGAVVFTLHKRSEAS